MLKVNRATLVAVMACSAAFLSASSLAQPQLTGIWTNASLTSLNRPQGVDSLVASPAEAEKIAAGTAIAGIAPGDFDDNAPSNSESGAPPAGSIDFGLRGYNSFWTDPGSSLALVKGEFRTSYIIDPPSGRVPRLEVPKVSFKDRGFGRRYLTGVGDNSGPEALPLAERCLLGFGNTAGPGMMGTLYNSTYQFVQTDDYVMILAEMAHDARIIPLFDSPEQARANSRPQVMEQWLGDSRGWYEGDTLIVETINIKPIQMEQSSVPITDDGIITERFSRHSDGEIVYQFIVEDSNLYRQPWTAELSFYATEGPVYEYACHEGNYAMPGILAGARLEESEAATGN
ncbi:MAG: hypothetical protein ACJA2D_000590 [Pseudohongiellaceae bacterium]|jgi:hypothetical protein